MSARLPRVVILISGRGSNMQAIAQATLAGRLPIQIAAVLSDQANAGGLDIARELGLQTGIVAAAPGMDRTLYDGELASRLQQVAPDLIVLAGFMRILGGGLVREFAGRMLNIHPSLLPKFRGLHTHTRVLTAGEREHGCSVHFVTEELDGGPVILQARVPVQPDDTEATLSARVQAQEHRIYPLVIDWFARGRLEWRAGAAWLDGEPLRAPRILNEERTP